MSIVILSLWLAFASHQEQSRPVAIATPQTTAIATREPFFGKIVERSQHLKALTDHYMMAPASVRQSPEFGAYVEDVNALAEADLKGHLDLKVRGTDSDLKCILKGLSLDVPIKRDLIVNAQSDAAFKDALSEMSLLLEDHIDILTTPATVDSGLDCTIEFGNS